MPKFCSSCGASVPDAARFCNKCGTKLVPTQPASAPVAPEPPPAYDPSSGSKQYDPTPSYNPSGYQSPMQYSEPQSGSAGLQRNIAGVLCYTLLVLTGILFLVIAPYNKDRFIRFHAFQSIFFHITWIVIGMVLSFLSEIMPWGISGLVSVMQFLTFLGGLGLWIYLMVKAYNNEEYKLPVIGDLAEQQAGKQH
jgi:uncharacterized membrane protein